MQNIVGFFSLHTLIGTKYKTGNKLNVYQHCFGKNLCCKKHLMYLWRKQSNLLLFSSFFSFSFLLQSNFAFNLFWCLRLKMELVQKMAWSKCIFGTRGKSLCLSLSNYRNPGHFVIFWKLKSQVYQNCGMYLNCWLITVSPVCYLLHLLLFQPPPTLPSGRFSNEFIDFVDRWSVIL